MENLNRSAGSHSIQDTSLPMRSAVGQIDGLQLLRAVAVALVVICHSAQVLHDLGGNTFPNVGAFGVDIFFVISGFILSFATMKDLHPAGVRSMWNFMKRRFIRIYPIYWVIALVTLARITHAGQLRTHNYFPAFFLLPAPFHPFIFTYSWTMMFEVFFYLLLGLTLLKTIKRAVPLLIAVLSLLVLIGAFTGINHPVWDVAANPILLEFVFGALIALLYTRIGPRRTAGIIITIAGLVATVLIRIQDSPKVASGFQMLIFSDGAFARVATWGVAAALIVGGVIFWSPSMDSFAGRWSVLMGNASYSAYLVSALTMEFSTRFYFKLTAPSTSRASGTVYQVVMIVADFVIGFGCYILIEKPLLQTLQNKLLRKKTPQPTLQPSLARPIPSGRFAMEEARAKSPAAPSASGHSAAQRLQPIEPSKTNIVS